MPIIYCLKLSLPPGGAVAAPDSPTARAPPDGRVGSGWRRQSAHQSRQRPRRRAKIGLIGSPFFNQLWNNHTSVYIPLKDLTQPGQCRQDT